MKKISVICTALCLLISGNAIAQNVKFGARLGGQVSAVRNIHWDSEARFPGITAGVFASFPLYTPSGDEISPAIAASSTPQLPTIMMNVEVLYFQQGEKDGEPHKCNFYQDYIAVPILFRGYTDNHLFFAEVGPQLNFMIHESNKDKDFEHKTFDTAIVVGAGFNFGSKKQFEIGARYAWGILDMYPENSGANRNGAIGLNLGYAFN